MLLFLLINVWEKYIPDQLQSDPLKQELFCQQLLRTEVNGCFGYLVEASISLNHLSRLP